MITFRLPDLGEGLQEAEIVSWHVGVGDHIVADQPLVSVETEKAVVEVPSPQSGQIAKLHAGVGDIIETGAPLVDFEEGEIADSGTVVGTVPTPPVKKPTYDEEEHIVAASPAVRSLARRLGVDLSTVTPTGRGGSVTREDIERAAADMADSKPEPLRGVRRAMARNMERSHAEVVPATVTDFADIGGWRAGEDVTMRLVQAIVAGCKVEPSLNAWYFGREVARVVHDHVDLGIAMDTPDGLFVPTLRNVDNRPVEDMRQGLEAMKRDVAARNVPLAELRGQTITLSNFGMYGGQHAVLVILPPQVAIIGAGQIREAIVPHDGKPVVRRVLPLSLTFEHRAVMGGEASRFLAAVKADLEREA